MKNIVKKAKQLALYEQKRTSMPLLQHIELSRNVGLELAKLHNADAKIVEAGIYLMDCMIGEAINQGKLTEHIKMSAYKTEELFENSDLNKKQRENIMHCVLEHHGVKKFYSLESEICCNADCYRFVSIKGFTYAMRYLEDMPFADLITLLENKVNEKWNALTLESCRNDLKPQHELIKEMMLYLRK